MSIPWLTASVLRRSQDQEEGSPATLHDEPEQDISDSGATPRLNNRSRLRIDMPPTNAPFTLAQNRTPGWETPWTSAHPNNVSSMDGQMHQERGSDDDDEKLTPWRRRRKRLRAYMMYNVYVPLVCHIPATYCFPSLPHPSAAFSHVQYRPYDGCPCNCSSYSSYRAACWGHRRLGPVPVSV